MNAQSKNWYLFSSNNHFKYSIMKSKKFALKLSYDYTPLQAFSKFISVVLKIFKQSCLAIPLLSLIINVKLFNNRNPILLSTVRGTYKVFILKVKMITDKIFIKMILMMNIITSGQTCQRRYHESNNNTQNRSNNSLKIILLKLSHFDKNLFIDKMALLFK